jgi:hypothetical protein
MRRRFRTGSIYVIRANDHNTDDGTGTTILIAGVFTGCETVGGCRFVKIGTIFHEDGPGYINVLSKSIRVIEREIVSVRDLGQYNRRKKHG